MNSIKRERERKMIGTGLDSTRYSVVDAIDLSVLISLEGAQADGEPDLIVELIDLYLEDTSRKLAAMSELLAKRDTLSLEQAAHALKGSSATLGAARTARTCEGIEQMTRNGSLAACAELIIEANWEFARVRGSLLIERSKRICQALGEPAAIADGSFEAEVDELNVFTHVKAGNEPKVRSNCYA